MGGKLLVVRTAGRWGRKLISGCNINTIIFLVNGAPEGIGLALRRGMERVVIPFRRGGLRRRGI